MSELTKEQLDEATFAELTKLRAENDKLRKELRAQQDMRLQLAQAEASRERLKQVLNDIWEADEMGYITDIICRKCVGCGEKAMSTTAIKHTDECVQGWIESALSEPPSDALRKLLEPEVEATLERIKGALQLAIGRLPVVEGGYYSAARFQCENALAALYKITGTL